MHAEVVLSGFGGQGVLFAGQLLAHTALDNDLHVTWFPSYGPEMRGGTAHCTVTISDDEIGSPVVRNPGAVIVMNLPSLDKYEPLVASGGKLVVNSSLVDREPEREDLDVVMVPANDIAEELGDRRLANMVVLGALAQMLGIFSIEQIGNSLEQHIPDRHKDLLGANLQALERGAALASPEAISA